MPINVNCEILDIPKKTIFSHNKKMTNFSDFIDHLSAVDALRFFEKEERILREQFGGFEFYRRRDLCMMAARRRRKLILDVHWLNRCLKTPYIEC